ncbi:hypothetical protein HY312_03190 [Candidatus Saccharibacteria bacterium]|nr:hypothetical protein [Candidatus Saccharibacteria bacterium]
MSESIAISYTPESKTTPERYFWDSFIGALNGLAHMSSEIDMRETLLEFEDEIEEDAVMLIYNYYIMICGEAGESTELDRVEAFLVHSGILE